MSVRDATGSESSFLWPPFSSTVSTPAGQSILSATRPESQVSDVSSSHNSTGAALHFSISVRVAIASENQAWGSRTAALRLFIVCHRYNTIWKQNFMGCLQSKNIQLQTGTWLWVSRLKQDLEAMSQTHPIALNSSSAGMNPCMNYVESMYESGNCFQALHLLFVLC